MRMVARATCTMVPDRILSSALRCHRCMATVTGSAAGERDHVGCSAQVHAARIALRAWRMTVADQAGDYQISNVPSEIHRDPVGVSRRPNGQRSTWSPHLTSPLRAAACASTRSS